MSDSVTHGLYSPWNSPDENTGMGSSSLLQGISPSQGSNTGLLHCRQILYQLSHKGSPVYSISKVKWSEVKSPSRVRLFAIPWTVAYQGPPSMARILEWVAIYSPGDLPDPVVEPKSPALQADALPSEPLGKHIQYKVHSKYGLNMWFLHYLSLHKIFINHKHPTLCFLRSLTHIY